MTTDKRLGNIGNILNGGAPRLRLEPELPAETPETAALTPGSAPPAKPADRPSAARRRDKAAPNASRDTIHRVPVRLDVDLRDRMDQAARAREATLSEVVFDALEAAHQSSQLVALIEEDTVQAGRPSRSSGALFHRPQGRAAALPTILTEFRFTGDDVKVLDDLVSEAAAASRSQLIKVSLRHHLGGGSTE